MPLPLFEIACVAIIFLTLVAMARSRPADALLLDYAALAVASWIGEQSCVELHDFYHYAPGWHARIGHVPLLVPLIWPLVILSARAVVSSLWPGRNGLFFRAAAVGMVVAFDASLVEVLAVRAGMWSWAEPGHLDVPIIGILGWGYFAAGAEAALSTGGRWSRIRLIVLGPIAAHALILATWWGCFRFAVRGDLGMFSVGAMAFIGAVALLAVNRARAAGTAIPMPIALPRMIAASLFIVLFVWTAPRDLPLWIHTLAVAIPYLAATRLSISRAA